MFDESFQTPIVLVASGLGLATFGSVRTLFGASRHKVWAAPIGGLIAVAIAALGSLVAAGKVALIAAAFIAILAIIRSSWARILVNSVVASARKPALFASLVCLGGVALAVYGVVGIDRAVEYAEFKEFTFFQVMSTMPPVAPEPAAFAQSDCGSLIRLMIPANARELEDLREIEHSILMCLQWNDCVIRRQPPGDSSNCHGWVFTGGQYWLTADEVERILEDNSYLPVREPRPGDLVIYRNRLGGVAHTAVIRAVCDDGVPIVEGKWGWMGVFLHRACDSCYGQEFSYFRSERDGHLLVGLPNAKPQVTTSLSAD